MTQLADTAEQQKQNTAGLLQDPVVEQKGAGLKTAMILLGVIVVLTAVAVGVVKYRSQASAVEVVAGPSLPKPPAPEQTSTTKAVAESLPVEPVITVTPPAENAIAPSFFSQQKPAQQVSSGRTSEEDKKFQTDTAESLEIMINQVTAILTQQRSDAAQLSSSFEGVNTNISEVAASLTVLSKQVEGLRSALQAMNNQQQQLQTQVESISELQSKDMNDLPVIIFGLSVWGSEQLLNVAYKDSPSNSFDLRVGSKVGQWTFSGVQGGKALFTNGVTERQELIP
jgi:hypothetical protein